jgi:hypothetical protein
MANSPSASEEGVLSASSDLLIKSVLFVANLEPL